MSSKQAQVTRSAVLPVEARKALWSKFWSDLLAQASEQMVQSSTDEDHQRTNEAA